MRFPSFSVIFSGVFIAYILHSLWTIGSLFVPPKCSDTKTQKCINSYLQTKPKLQLLLYSTVKNQISSTDDLNLLASYPIAYELESESEKIENITLPFRARKNGTLYLHAFLVKRSFEKNWLAALNDPNTVYTAGEMTQYQVPVAEAFNLLGENKEDTKGKSSLAPITHLKSKIVINILNHNEPLPTKDLPMDVAQMLSLSPNNLYLPSLSIDQLSSRLQDLVQVNTSVSEYPVKFVISPISFGKLRLWLQFTGALQTLKQMGFTEKDIDEMKGIFADTNVVFLCATFLVAALHLLFDFLAFKNDVSFWKNRENMIGVSTRTLLWRTFSQIVIFFYLMDENTSLLVLVPAAIGAVIEMWKVTKAFRVSVQWTGLVPRLQMGPSNQEELETEAYDTESMRYLSYLLYPLCLAGAVYSLIYTPHRSWYSWVIQSLVNGVYAFGFLFMLPQLFVNYKLKSVAHLPWKAFMYKAFNTFIDDVFAFIITMPTAHRVACFRDDIVFLVYLYQRWLYPVDKKRTNEFGATGEEIEAKKTK